jgi:hypothetical protein
MYDRRFAVSHNLKQAKSAFRVTPSGVSYCRFITAKAVTLNLIF